MANFRPQMQSMCKMLESQLPTGAGIILIVVTPTFIMGEERVESDMVTNLSPDFARYVLDHVSLGNQKFVDLSGKEVDHGKN